MPTLIACLSTGKGSWVEVSKLVHTGGWKKVILVTNQFGKDNFKHQHPGIELIVINNFSGTHSLVEVIKKQFADKVDGFEVALNLSSGAGNEHMAVLEAVLELGLNFRLVTLKDGQVNVLGLNDRNSAD